MLIDAHPHTFRGTNLPITPAWKNCHHLEVNRPSLQGLADGDQVQAASRQAVDGNVTVEVHALTEVFVVANEKDRACVTLKC